MNCFHYTPGYLSLSRKNLSWHKNNFHSFPHISLLSTLALLKNWGIVFLPAAPRPAFSSNHTPQSVGRKLTTLRERSVRIREVKGSNPSRSTTLGRRLWISHSGAKLWDTPVNNRCVPLFFMFIFGCSRFYPEIEMHHFCEWERKAGFTGESIAPLLTRMFLSAPLLSR